MIGCGLTVSNLARHCPLRVSGWVSLLYFFARVYATNLAGAQALRMIFIVCKLPGLWPGSSVLLKCLKEKDSAANNEPTSV